MRPGILYVTSIVALEWERSSDDDQITPQGERKLKCDSLAFVHEGHI
jgi:hypothetical protein